MASNENFPSIGTLADRTDALEERNDQQDPTQKVEEEGRPLQEVESLCMSCHEQVFTLRVHCRPKWLINHQGYHPLDASIYPIL